MVQLNFGFDIQVCEFSSVMLMVYVRSNENSFLVYKSYWKKCSV